MNEGQNRRRPWKRGISLGIALLLLALIFVWSAGDLFVVPREVTWSRKQYQALLKSYLEDQGDWDAKRQELIGELTAQEDGSDAHDHAIPLEVVLSYMVESLGFTEGEFVDVALYPAQDFSSLRFYLSKHEPHPWPFKILLSLEAKLVYSSGRWDVKFLHFRRGKRELPAGLAWIYLGPELQRLRTFESFADLSPSLALSPEESTVPSLKTR